MSGHGWNSTSSIQSSSTVGHWVLRVICHQVSTSILSFVSIHLESENLWYNKHPTQRRKTSSYSVPCQSTHSPGTRYSINTFIVLQITGNHPECMISPVQSWKHLEGLTLAYDKPGKIGILLGVRIFVEVIRHCWWIGPHNTPTALNTNFGWVLARNTGAQTDTMLVSTHLTSVVTGMTGDDLLWQLWEVEEKTVANCTLTVKEQCALEHFNSHHSHNDKGRFIVPLPKHSVETKLSESRSQTVVSFCHLIDPST